MTTDAKLDLKGIAALLARPDLARHVAGLPRLRVAVTAEAGPLSGRFAQGATEVTVGGPVDADAAREAFHVSRTIPREGGRLRLDFSYPPADLSGEAVLGPDGRVEAMDLSRA